MRLDLMNKIQCLFGKEPATDDKYMQTAWEDVERYQDTRHLNLTAVIANKLANYALCGSSISITGMDGKPNARSTMLNEIAQKAWRNAKQNIAVGLGCGAIASLPYSVSGFTKRKIYIDTVAKDRLVITGTQGDEIVSCSVLSDARIINGSSYERWTDYSVQNDVYVIKQKAMLDGEAAPLSVLKEWENIQPEIAIGGVEQLPLGIFYCPTSNRRPKSLDGVPITYGCDQTLSRIDQCLADIDEEFKLKKPRLIVSRTFLDKEKKLNSSLFTPANPADKMDGGGFFEIFDPAIRDSAYFNKLTHLMGQLEKEIGASKGVLTELPTNGGTATEMRHAMFDTFSLCDDIHNNVKRYFDSLIYGCNVLMNYYDLSPVGDYKIDYDWSYALLADSEATWRMLTDAVSNGVERKAELRRFHHPEETMEEAQAVIDSIRKGEMAVSDGTGA